MQGKIVGVVIECGACRASNYLTGACLEGVAPKVCGVCGESVELPMPIVPAGIGGLESLDEDCIDLSVTPDDGTEEA